MFLINSIINVLRCVVLEPFRRGEKALVISSAVLQASLINGISVPGGRRVTALFRLLLRRSVLPRSVAQLLSHVGGAVGRPARIVGVAFTPGATIVILVCQVVLEGRRWQLWPVYVSTGASHAPATVRLRNNLSVVSVISRRCGDAPREMSSASCPTGSWNMLPPRHGSVGSTERRIPVVRSPQADRAVQVRSGDHERKNAVHEF